MKNPTLDYATTWKHLMEMIGVETKKRSSGVLVVKCIFHNEYTPSLHLWPSGNFLCQGCGHGGDINDFIKMYFKISDEETLEFIKRNGVRFISENQLEIPL